MKRRSEADSVVAERRGAAMVLTIDRPNAGNAISEEVARSLRRHLEVCATTTDVRAIVLTGRGERFFCAGGDVKQYRSIETEAQLKRLFGFLRSTLDAIESLDKVVIAALNGYALGGGAELSLACDLRVGERGARIGFPQIRLGLSPAWHGGRRLVELVGRGRALQLLLTGEPVDMQEAHRLGLVDIVAPDGRAVETALAWAQKLDDVAPLAIGAAKKVVFAAAREPVARSSRIEEETFVRLWFTQDHREAERAFVEKRTPRFVGR